MRIAWTCLVAVWVLTPVASARAEDPPPAPVVVIEDQYERPHYLAAERGDVIVLIYGDRHSTAANHDFGTALHVHFHPSAQGMPPAQAYQAPPRPIPNWPPDRRVTDVHVLPISCLGRVPSLIASLIRSQVRGRYPNVPVCLDFEDKMKEYFGLASGVSNVVVVDTQGRVRYRGHGNINAVQFEQLVQFIERLRREPLTQTEKVSQ
jgi:hypothetical protein